jgi:NAD(P)-dependent dehydrogenase (short-subunit alcohol dehydrogenase family)
MTADTLSLAGKTAFVTGSGRETGIGAAIARALARNGASVAIHYVSDGVKTRAEQVAKDITKDFGTKTTVVQGRLEKPETAKTMVEQILKDLGVDHIDILGMLSVMNLIVKWADDHGTLVNNAAVAYMSPMLHVKPEELEHEFGCNVFGLMYMIQAVVGAGRMPKGGRIINIGSISSKALVPNIMYSASKATTDALTTLWAAEVSIPVLSYL